MTRAAEAIKEGSVPRILLLEDDFELAMRYRERFEDANFVVYHEVEVDSALATLQEVNIDLAVVDILIRDWEGQTKPTGGLTLISRIRNDSSRRLPIIAISGGSPSLALLRHAESLDVDATMDKPLNLEELISESNRLVSLYAERERPQNRSQICDEP